eukprot:763695-Rhodomonas_salina.1
MGRYPDRWIFTAYAGVWCRLKLNPGATIEIILPDFTDGQQCWLPVAYPRHAGDCSLYMEVGGPEYSETGSGRKGWDGKGDWAQAVVVEWCEGGDRSLQPARPSILSPYRVLCPRPHQMKPSIGAACPSKT